MKKEKIVLPLFSALMVANVHYVEAAPPMPAQQGLEKGSSKVAGVNPADKAAALLANGAYMDGVVFLEPYIQNNTATDLMKELYIEALIKSGLAEDGIEEAHKLWPQSIRMPQNIKQLVADSCLQNGKSIPAAAMYRELLEQKPGNVDNKAKLAYNLIHGGQVSEGLVLYEEVLREKPKLADSAVEDAVALLAQGNILGGRMLFEKVIAVNPDKTEYRQQYADTLVLYNVEKPAQIQYTAIIEAQAITPAEQRQQQHQQALQDAKNKNYREALSMLSWLHNSKPEDHPVTYDYITVQQQAGNAPAALKLYETVKNQDVPDKVRQSAIDAYVSIGSYQQAYDSINLLSDKDSSANCLRSAELLMRLGQNAEAHAMYEELAQQEDQKLEVRLRYGAIAAEVKDYRQAAINYEQAVALLTNQRTQTATLRKVRGELAAVCLEMRQPQRAVELLVPYIKNNAASDVMKSHYLAALVQLGENKLAAAEAVRFWPELSAAPLEGLRAVARAYIKLNDRTKAIALYQLIVAREPDGSGEQRSLALNLLLQGKMVQGMETYHALLKREPEMAVLVMDDAALLLAAEKYVLGKTAFELVLKEFPDKGAYRLKYAQTLAGQGLYKSAYRQYEELSKMAEFRDVGLSGMVKMSLQLEDIRTAEDVLKIFKAGREKNRETAELSALLKEQRRGKLETAYGASSADGSHSWSLTAEEYLTNRLWLLAGTAGDHVTDGDTREYKTISSRSVGVRYSNLDNKSDIWLSRSSGDDGFGTVRASTEQRLNDEMTVRAEVSRLPVRDVQALSQPGGPVMVDGYDIVISQELSKAEKITAGIQHGWFSDSNQTQGVTLGHEYIVYHSANDSITRNLYWNRLNFTAQTTMYDSPVMREGAGIAWTLRHNVDKGYWQGKIAANWGRDYPDQLSFNPTARLEYEHELAAGSTLKLGVEYALSAEGAIGKGGFKYTGRQVDALYSAVW